MTGSDSGSGSAGGPGCGLESAAFCETFDAPHNGGTQTGDLDPVLWGVSRVADFNLFGGILNGVVPSHNACAGGGVNPDGSTFGPSTAPPSDIQICHGQMAQSANDGHGVVNSDTYPKQPFNFAGRTGIVVFDVSADSGGTHAAWPEFLITDEPVPGIRRAISAATPEDVAKNVHAKNEIGFSIDGGCTGVPNATGVGVVMFSKDGVYQELSDGFRDCVQKGSSTAMNHFEVHVSADLIEVWASDPGETTVKKIASETIPGSLGFSQGLVWLNDAHYNARKEIEPCECGIQFDHTVFWDNLGFDGPKTYRDLGYDVPYANDPGGNSIGGDPEINEGYHIGNGPVSFTTPEVSWVQTPTKAKVVLNAMTYDDGATLTVSLNGHAAVTRPIESWMTHSISFEFPTTDAVQGTNTLTFSSTSGLTGVTNVSLIMVAGAPVP